MTREEKAAYDRAYREANREKDLERKRAYYGANREKILERQRAYNGANREKVLERQRAYYEANREKVIERKCANREMNPWQQHDPWFDHRPRVCCICGRSAACRDHCHPCGGTKRRRRHPRGWLCHTCNIGLGYYENWYQRGAMRDQIEAYLAAAGPCRGVKG